MLHGLMIFTGFVLLLMIYYLFTVIMDCYFLYKLNKLNKKCESYLTCIPLLNWTGKAIHSDCSPLVGSVILIAQILINLLNNTNLTTLVGILGWVVIIGNIFIKIKFYKLYNLGIGRLITSLFLGNWIMYYKVINENN